MRLLGLLGGQHLRDPQRVDAVGELPLEALHLVGAAVRGVVDQQRLRGDAALLLAGPAADRPDHAAVLDGRQPELGLHGAVDETVDAVRDLRADVRRDVVAATDHDVGAQAAHELLVLLVGVGDDPQAVGLGHLDDVPPERAGGAGHRQRPARSAGPAGPSSRRAVSAFITKVEPAGKSTSSGEPQHRGVGYDDLVGVRAARVTERHHHGRHPVAHAPARALADLVDDPGRVGTGHERAGLVGVPLLVPPRAQPAVGRVHRRGVHADAHLAGPGVRLGQVQDLQVLGAAELCHSDSSHGGPNAPDPAHLPGSGAWIRPGYWWA